MPHDLSFPAPIPGHGLVPEGEAMSSAHSRHMVLIDQLIAWQIANPGKPWTLAAQAFGLSAQWCRMVASTDAFKARYAGIKDDLIREIGMLGLKERIEAAAAVALDRMAAKLEVSESLGDITDATEVLLTAAYGKPGASAPVQTPQVSINTQVILDARSRITSGANGELASLPQPLQQLDTKPKE